MVRDGNEDPSSSTAQDASQLFFPATSTLKGGVHAELLRAGRSRDRPPFHPYASAVCSIRWFARGLGADAAAEAGDFEVTAAEDLKRVARRSATEALRFDGGVAEPGSLPWAELLQGMELGSISRYRPAPDDRDLSVVVVELVGWIEERPLPGEDGGTLYMERGEGVNDGSCLPLPSVTDGSVSDVPLDTPPEPLAVVQVRYRAVRGDHVVATAPHGTQVLVDEPASHKSGAHESGCSGEALPAKLVAAFDFALRCMKRGETAELEGPFGWHLELELLSVANPKPAYEMGPAEKLLEARQRRTQGNACYAEQAWERALNRYVLAAAAVAHADQDTNFDAAERHAARQEKLLVALNVAATALQMGQPQQALEQCNDALAIEPAAFKAWWRRGKARIELGDPEGAILDLKRALELAPAKSQRREVRKELAKASELRKKHVAVQVSEPSYVESRPPCKQKLVRLV